MLAAQPYTAARHHRAPRNRRLSPPPRKLAATEDEKVLQVLHAPENVDQTPRELFAKLLTAGLFLASVSTMYRLLARTGSSKERRRGHVHRNHVMPQLVATAPNQVWSWDITKVPGIERGVFYYVYVILDLFSRFVVGWLASDRENAALATYLIRETCSRHAIEPGQLTLHSDRGSPMTAGTMTQLLANLEIAQSLSRPRVSNDNPFSESQFKTAKYRPDYPGNFCSVLHVRGHFDGLFSWYNNDHHHQGLNLFTPADVYFGRARDVAAKRQAAMDAAYHAHPERFVNGPPKVALPPARVHINLPPEPLEHDQSTGSGRDGVSPQATHGPVEHRAARNPPAGNDGSAARHGTARSGGSVLVD